MKMSLKEMVNTYGHCMSDTDIIWHYFVNNGIEDEAIEMISRLSSNAIREKRENLRMVSSYALMISSNFANIQRCYGESAQYMLDIMMWYITTVMVSDEEPEIPERIIDIMEKINRINMPNGAMFFQPCLEWLHKKGVYFKNE